LYAGGTFLTYQRGAPFDVVSTRVWPALITAALQPVEGFAATDAASTVVDVDAGGDEVPDVGVAVFPVPLEHAAADRTMNTSALRPSVCAPGFLSRVIVNLIDRVEISERSVLNAATWSP
jgi:hypothetical protein